MQRVPVMKSECDACVSNEMCRSQTAATDSDVVRVTVSDQKTVAYPDLGTDMGAVTAGTHPYQNGTSVSHASVFGAIVVRVVGVGVSLLFNLHFMCV